MTVHAERDLLLDLAYGELSERDARRVRGHVEGCPTCRAELSRIEETRKLFSALPEEPAPAAGERILLAAAREAAERARPAHRLPRWLVPATALAATIAIVTAVALRTGSESAGPLHRGDDRDALMRGEPAAADGARAAPAREVEAAREKEMAPAPAKVMKSAPAEEKDVASAYAEAPPPPAGAKRARREAPAAPPVPAQAQAPTEEGRPAGRNPAPEPRPDAAGSLGRAGAGDSTAATEEAVRSAAADEDAGFRGGAPAAKAEQEGARVADRKRSAPAAAAPRPPAAERRAEPARTENGSEPLVRTFPGCAGETRREIGRDAFGRVVRFAREGVAGGRRVRVELRFGEDGTLLSTRARDLDTGEPLPAAVLPGLPRAAAQVDPEAPPRCGP